MAWVPIVRVLMWCECVCVCCACPACRWQEWAIYAAEQERERRVLELRLLEEVRSIACHALPSRLLWVV